jgi:signal transduction histidine kinase
MKQAGFGSSSSRGPVVATLALAIAGHLGCAQPESNRAPLPITRGSILLTGGDTPPPDDAAWQPVSLPDDWSRTRPQVGGDAWYRVQFEIASNRPQLSAIYVPRVSMIGTPYVNGSRLADAGTFDEPVRRLWYRPQLYWVPPELLRPGPNVLHYRIRCYPDNQGGVSQIYVGEPEPLHAMWRSHSFRQVTAMQITTGIAFALGVLVLVAWAMLKWSSAYGYFGLAALFWTLHATLVLTVNIPLPNLVWEVLIVGSLMWVVVAMMMFALRFAGLRRPWLERAALVYAVLAPALLWAAGLTRIFDVANVLLLGLLVIGVYVFKLLLDVARRTRSMESVLLLGAGFFVLGLGAHDWFNRQGAFDYAEPFNLHYGVPVLFLAVYWNLLGQVTAGRRAADRLNIDLEARVQLKADELERSYDRLRSARDAEALSGERERIMRDMHDGVGSQLIAARHLAHSGALDSRELTALLDECIDDLRLMIDSLEPTDGDLVTVLGNLRYRVSQRLAHHDLTLRWEMADIPPTGLAPRDLLQVLRIVQEAIANVIKHADASEVVVSAGPSPDGRYVVLSVRDNGHGLSADGRSEAPVPAPGRGLGNMRQRAAAVKGHLRIDSGTTGCVITLMLPVRGPGVDSEASSAVPGNEQNEAAS